MNQMEMNTNVEPSPANQAVTVQEPNLKPTQTL